MSAVFPAPRLTASLDSKVVTGGGVTRTVLAGSGRQAQYGPFSFDAEIAADGPRAVLVLADPYPAAGLKDVRIALAPSAEGFGLDVAGGSLLGPFDGALELFLPENAPTRIAINRLDVYRTNVTGEVVLGDAGHEGPVIWATGWRRMRACTASSSRARAASSPPSTASSNCWPAVPRKLSMA